MNWRKARRSLTPYPRYKPHSNRAVLLGNHCNFSQPASENASRLQSEALMDGNFRFFRFDVYRRPIKGYFQNICYVIDREPQAG